MGMRKPLLLFALFSGCGPWNVRPECQAAYDECVDGCGDRCGRGDGPSASQTSGPELSDTWNNECSACEYGCRDTRDRCTAR